MAGRRRIAIFVACLATGLWLQPLTATGVWAGNSDGGAPPVPAKGAHQLMDQTNLPPDPSILPGKKANPLPRNAKALRTAFLGGAKPPDPEVLGFAQSGEVAYGGWVNDIRLNDVSTIAYFGININGDGSLYTGNLGYQAWWSAQATDLINAAHAHGDRVVLTVKAFDTATIESIIGSETPRQAAIGNIIGQLQQRGGDGVNVDFEGGSGTDAANYTTFISELHSALQSQLPQSSYLSVDTYASSGWGGTIMNISSLKNYVDTFMVMDYDVDFPSTTPNAPLYGNYTYSDSNVMQHYLSLVPAYQVIMGVPYYGYKYSTTSNLWNAPRGGDNAATADTYSDALADFSCAQQVSMNWDSASATPWASWWSPASGDPCGGNHSSWRELYYDNAQSLGDKYDLVNNLHLRGIGIWALGYDSGTSDLWNEIELKFSVTHSPVAIIDAVAATQSARSFTLSWQLEPGSQAAAWYQVYVRDSTGPWQMWAKTTATSTTMFGFPGHTYYFGVEAFGANGVGSGEPVGNGDATTTISSSAPATLPFTSMYALDAYGVLRSESSPPQSIGPPWSWKIARGVALNSDGMGGVVLDGWGGLHAFGDAGSVSGSSSWPGWDIARGITEDGSGKGYYMDGFGGLHPFATGSNPLPPAAVNPNYWPGWDIAKAVVEFSDGKGGLILDGYGGLHPWGVSEGPAPASVHAGFGYWPGWNIARTVVLTPGSTYAAYSGYVLDGFGGLHPFSGGTASSPPGAAGGPYWGGFDIARGVALEPGSATAGWVFDGYGGVHAFGGAPDVSIPYYTPGIDAVRASAAA